MIDTVKPARCRRISLPAPLEVFPTTGLISAVPASYRVRAIIVDSEGNLDSVSHDMLGLPVPSGAMRRQLAREAVRVLGMQGQIAPARRLRGARRPSSTSLIPELWGIRLRGISQKRVG